MSEMVECSKGWALLIGAPGRDLLGVRNNLDRMAEVLRARGFANICERINPGRRGIIEELTRLSSAVSEDDRVAIYFNGHTGLTRFRGGLPGDDGHERICRYMLVGDPEHSRIRESFRGLLDVEFRHLVGVEMLARCPNITVILECCYAGGLARDIADVHYFSVPDFMRDDPIWQRPTRAECEGREWVVLAAARDEQEAMETRERPALGQFTKALTEVLSEHGGRRSSWRKVMRELRQRALASTMQRSGPHVLGPSARAPFSLEEVGVRDGYELCYDSSGQAWVFAGSLHGLASGDEVRLVDAQGEHLGCAQLDEVSELRSTLQVGELPGEPRAAVLHRRVQPTLVEVNGVTPVAEALRTAVERSPWLGSPGEGAEQVVRVMVEPGGLEIDAYDFVRVPRRWPLSFEATLDPEIQIAVIVGDLEAIARRRAFVAAATRAAGPSIDEFQPFLRVTNAIGELVDLAEAGFRAHRGPMQVGYVLEQTRVKARVRQLTLISEGCSGRLSVVPPRGVVASVPGTKQEQRVDLIASWPADVPRTPRHESMWFVITTQEVEFDSLEVNLLQLARAGRGALADHWFRGGEVVVLRFCYELDPD